jgi:hypothetical protein
MAGVQTAHSRYERDGLALAPPLPDQRADLVACGQQLHQA